MTAMLSVMNVLLLLVNTVFIVLIFFLFRRYRNEMQDVTSHAKAYYTMARTRESRAARAVEEIPQVVENAIRESSGNSGIHT